MRNKKETLSKVTSIKEFETIVSDANNQEIKQILRCIGKLDKSESDEVFFKLLNTFQDNEIQFLSAKHIGKVLKINNIERLYDIIIKLDNTEIIRELYSAIGRLRVKENIPYLAKGLKSNDPKIVMQCIRGLLVHKKNDDVVVMLKKSLNHKNEMIREIINNELNKTISKKNNKNYTYVEPLLKNKMILGDALSILKKIPNETFHLTFTSPPYYNAKDYSLYNSYEDYLYFLENVFTEIHRTTKEGAFFVLNTSPIIIPRFSREYSSKRYLIPYDIHPRISKIGFEFIEEIIWKKPEASAPNRNGGFFQQRKPLAYKANHCTESVIVYRKKTSRLIDWNIAQYPKEIVEASRVTGNYFRSNVWDIAPSSSSHHPAIFPLELAENVIKLYSMQGDLILDPFAGICTVARACVQNKRNFCMLERDSKYLNFGLETTKSIYSEIEMVNEKSLNL